MNAGMVLKVLFRKEIESGMKGISRTKLLLSPSKCKVMVRKTAVEILVVSTEETINTLYEGYR